MYYKIASLVLNSGQKNNSIADIFIAQPDSAKEALVGKIFVLAEIESQKNESAKLLDFLINNLNYNYYQNEKVILREKIDTISVESIFEGALSKTNKDLIEFLDKEKIKTSPYSINITACLLHNNELYFTNIGKNKCLLLHKEKVTTKSLKGKSEPLEKIEYKLTDIGKAPEEDNSAVTMDKLFSEVMSGKIPPGGYFLVINEALSEYISGKQLIDITTRLSPTGSVEQIRNILEKINSYVSFLGVIVKNTSSTSWSSDELKKQIDREIKNWDYKPEIVSTEEQTEAIMTPAGTINLKKWVKAITNKISSKNKTSAPIPVSTNKKAGKLFMLKDKILMKKRVPALSLEKLLVFFKKIGIIFFKIGFGVFSKKRNMDSIDDTGANNDGTTSSKTSKWPKIFLSAAALLVILLIGNVFISQKKHEQEQHQASFNSLISEINRNQDKVDSFLIYDNNSEAKKLWDDNKSLLGQIPEEEKAIRSDVSSLFERQDEQLAKLRKIKDISNVEKIADFSKLNQDAKPENITFLNGKLYAAAAPEKAIYKVDIKDNLVTASYNLSELKKMDHPSPSPDGIAYLDDGAVILVGEKSEFQKVTIQNPPENIGGLGMYGGRLYLSDKTSGQIWRYSKIGDEFSSPQEWLNNKTDLSLATDIFIDGNIYVLKSDGTVDKYLKGEKEVFALEAVDEPVTQASKLIVGENAIYVLELSSKRLIKFDLKGKLVNQYKFSQPEAITDITVSDADNQAFILSGQEVYQAKLE